MDATTYAEPGTSGLIPLGLHFGLPAEAYHRDVGLGSGHIRKLARNPADYWYESWMNPKRPREKDTPSRLRGRAMHSIVLEGERAFGSAYSRGPDHDEDMTPAEKSAATKAAKKLLIGTGKEMVPAEDYDRVAIAGAMITRNPALKTAFLNGIPEASLIYERDGIRRKARFDYLKIRGIADLKGCANTRGIAFPAACRNDITNHNLAEQASWYMDARAQVPRMVADGAVYGDHDPEWLKKLAAQEVYGWQFVFFQMEGAPITWSAIISPGSPVLETGRMWNNHGISNYKKYMAEFGVRDMWVLIEEPQELAIEDMPTWFGRS